MNSARGRQHSMKGYKSSSSHNHHHENNNYNASSNHGIFRTSRIQRHNLKWRKDPYYRGNLRSKFSYRRNDFSNRRVNKSTEDAEEEERKKKLNDTAKKLLSKIKTWNAETNCEEKSQQNCSLNQIVSENSCNLNEEKNNVEGKPKRIAHSKKAKLVKSRTRKSFSQPSKTITRYEVNKDTVKDFQNRIQHKLIEEIMQMPKENLQNVLNDPKINPIMEVKMSRLVQENKPLIAQKLRALAESKMKSLDYSMNPQFLVDIDKLIDPVIETDLSVLPYELIKQMENVFQVQFDYSHSDLDSPIKNGLPEGAIITEKVEERCGMGLKNSTQNVKKENNEDLSLYECSTDEDEEVGAKSLNSDQECDLRVALGKIVTETQKAAEASTSIQINPVEKIKKRKHSSSKSLIEINKEQKLLRLESENTCLLESYHSSELQVPNQYVSDEPIENEATSKEFSSVSCQTVSNFEDLLAHGQFQSVEVDNLYGVPLPKKTTNESVSSLLEEVNSIQNLINKLNERRLMIFLQLAKINPSGSFVSDDATEKNFIETISNGNLYLVESLKQFFKGHQQESYKYSRFRSDRSNQKLPEKFTGRNKSRNLRKDK